MKRPYLSAFAAVAATGALVVAGCGGDDQESNDSASAGSSTTMQSQDTRGDAAVESGASELRAGLTSLLEEHVYLAGIAVSTGVGEGLDSRQFEAAAGALDENSVALSEAIGGVYGDGAGEQFLSIWRDHIGFFVDYTKAKAANDERAAEKARSDLDGYRAEFGAFLASANPNLTKEAVADELKPHVESVFAVIDAVVEGSPDTFDLLREASEHMPGTAAVLAGAIAKQHPDQFSGTTDSGGAELRSGLTSLLEEHVYLAGLAVSAGVGEGLDSGEFEAAAGVLDENSVALSEAIGGVYGDAAGEQFLALWRDHIGFFVDYTKARASNDRRAAAKAKRDLDGYRAEFGAFLASANPNLSQEAVAEELKPHVESLFRAIDAVVAGEPEAFELLRAASEHMPGTANVLATAIAKQHPDKF